MQIRIDSDVYLNSRPLKCDIDLVHGINLFSGENGIGKSSFIHFLKKQQNFIFKEKGISFVDQKFLNPINKISMKDLLLDFKHCRFNKNEMFDDLAQDISFLDKPINELSGGQNQIAKILFSLYLDGEIYIFDEPFHYLDDKNTILFVNLLKKLKEKNKYIIIVEHRAAWLISELIDKKFKLEADKNSIKIVSHHD